MKQRTFILIKPDAVHRGLAFRVLSRFEDSGLKLIGMKTVLLDDSSLQGLYPTLVKKPFFKQVKAVMCSGPSIACVFEGHCAVESAFTIAGKEKNPEFDSSQSIRRSFALWTGADLVHRAATESEALTQIDIFFNANELISYYRLGEEFTSQESWDEFGSRWE